MSEEQRVIAWVLAELKIIHNLSDSVKLRAQLNALCGMLTGALPLKDPS
jgi:hypothetical protein